jgi:hypothetical protein
LGERVSSPIMKLPRLLGEGPMGKPVANPQWRPPSQWIAIGPSAHPPKVVAILSKNQVTGTE